MKIPKRLRQAATAAAMLVATYTPAALAQDFYSGKPAPTQTQLDMRVQESEGDISGTIIPKVFGKRWLAVAPFNQDGQNLGLNIGRIHNIDDNNGAITALGLFKDENGDYRVANLQGYFTNETGRWTTDLEASLATHLTTKKITPRGAFTLGYGLTDRLRLGGSVAVTPGEKPAYQAIARFDFPHKDGGRTWIQGYAGRNSLGFRLAWNPKFGK